MSVRAADDFEAIRARIEELREPPLPERVSPQECPSHDFDALSHRCRHCNLHYYHLASQQPTRSRGVT